MKTTRSLPNIELRPGRFTGSHKFVSSYRGNDYETISYNGKPSTVKRLEFQTIILALADGDRWAERHVNARVDKFIIVQP